MRSNLILIFLIEKFVNLHIFENMLCNDSLLILQVVSHRVRPYLENVFNNTTYSHHGLYQLQS